MVKWPARESKRLASETAGEQKTRLSRERLRWAARQRERLASETAEERETRLSRERLRRAARQREHLASETAERETRLSRGRLRRAARESPQRREARLSQARLNQERRLAAESPPHRAARLQDLRARQQERIDSETPEETAARRQRDREALAHRPPPVSAQPLLHQPAVQARIKRFHSQLASLDVSTCTTCLERFPGMTTRHTAAGTVCIRCHRDTHSPKAYSWENNMHPGPVPVQLVVSVYCFGVDLSHIIQFVICRG